LSSLAIAMVWEEDEIRVLNMKIVGKRETQDKFICLFLTIFDAD